MKIYTLERIKELGYEVENKMLEHVKIQFVSHFNSIELYLLFDNCSLRGYNNTHNVGYMFKFLIDFLEIDSQYISVSDLKNIPVRIILNSDKQVIGIGHFVKDKFFIYEELAQLRNLVDISGF